MHAIELFPHLILILNLSEFFAKPKKSSRHGRPAARAPPNAPPLPGCWPRSSPGKREIASNSGLDISGPLAGLAAILRTALNRSEPLGTARNRSEPLGTARNQKQKRSETSDISDRVLRHLQRAAPSHHSPFASSHSCRTETAKTSRASRALELLGTDRMSTACLTPCQSQQEGEWTHIELKHSGVKQLAMFHVM